jgi:hypothetical protein
MMKICAVVREHLAELAPAALARLDAFGFSERREAAWSLITSAAAPLLGFVVLDWPVAAAAVCLCLNLAIVLAGDWLRVLAAPSGIRSIALEATHDQFVFRVAGALARGRREVRSKWLPSLPELDKPRMASEVLIVSPLSFGPALFTAWLIQNDETLHAEPATLVIGTLPTVLVVIGALVFAIAHARAAWRETGSVRMQTAGGNASLVMLVGMFTLLHVGMFMPDPMTTPEDFLVLACLGVAGFGIWRLFTLAELRRTAAWLRARYVDT